MRYFVGDIEFDDAYWDCDCVTNYIKPRAELECGTCGALRDDQPDSWVDEIEFFKVLEGQFFGPCCIENCPNMATHRFKGQFYCEECYLENENE